MTGSAFNDVLIGTISDDVLSGGDGHDIIRSGPGSDELTGGGGMDIFKWVSGDLDNGSVDTIMDFQTGLVGDTLDVTGLVTVIDWLSEAASDPIPAPETVVENFLRLDEDNNGSTKVSIDVSGTATNFVEFVVLQGLTGLSLQTLLADGNVMI